MYYIILFWSSYFIFCFLFLLIKLNRSVKCSLSWLLYDRICICLGWWLLSTLNWVLHIVKSIHIIHFRGVLFIASSDIRHCHESCIYFTISAYTVCLLNGIVSTTENNNKTKQKHENQRKLRESETLWETPELQRLQGVN